MRTKFTNALKKFGRSFIAAYLFALVATLVILAVLGVFIKTFAELGGWIYGLLGVTYGASG